MKVPFRFDAGNHEYIALDTGETLPHITGMLDRAGLVDDLWFTEESSARGVCVHKDTADFDLGALDLATHVSIHKGYLLAYVEAMKMLKPTILAVEVPLVHSLYRFGGRPDRDVELFGLRGTMEIKAAQEADSHRIQTALQAILIAEQTALKPEDLGRWCLYLKPTGKYRFVDHNADRYKKMRDFREAQRVIRLCCGPARGPVSPWGLDRVGAGDIF